MTEKKGDRCLVHLANTQGGQDDIMKTVDQPNCYVSHRTAVARLFFVCVCVCLLILSVSFKSF